MIGRIAPPREFEEHLDRFTSPPAEGEPALFETKQKALMFAATLGRRRGERTKVERKGGGIRYDVFQHEMDDGYVDALAIAATDGDLTVLAPERADERVQIFEEYAHTGLKEMVDRCFRRSGDPLEELLAIADELRAEPTEGLTGMDPNLLKKLMGS
jgi:dnd system-associated protein 4